jgi:hypothetical protein
MVRELIKYYKIMDSHLIFHLSPSPRFSITEKPRGDRSLFIVLKSFSPLFYSPSLIEAEKKGDNIPQHFREGVG